MTYSLERVKCRRQTTYKGINFFVFVLSHENLKWRRWHLPKISNFLTLELEKFLCSDYTTNMESFFHICSKFDCYSITYMFNFVPFSLPGAFRSHKIQCYGSLGTFPWEDQGNDVTCIAAKTNFCLLSNQKEY